MLFAELCAKRCVIQRSYSGKYDECAENGMEGSGIRLPDRGQEWPDGTPSSEGAGRGRGHERSAAVQRCKNRT